MESDDQMSELRLQFQALQKQQEKRKQGRKKEKQADKHDDSGAQDDLDLSKQGIQADSDIPQNRWVLMKCFGKYFPDKLLHKQP